ncbi:MAG: cyclic nucleotide-binding domain-containing protein [Deltaproteobacteria bacterium]|nr:cyclic nucleotide-binding domain-containing protein [Deltaproteobacteria bacterium]
MSFLDESPKQIKAKNAIVGTVEYFLRDHFLKGDKRLFNLFAEDGESVKIIPFDVFEEMILEYDFGYNTNIFLARALELSNQFYTSKVDNLSKGANDYKRRAEVFARFVSEIEKLSKTLKLSEMVPFIEKHKATQIFEDGDILNADSDFLRVQLENKVTKFIHRYEKDKFVFEQNDKAYCMYILLKGRVSVIIDGEDVATIDQPGEAFGEMSLFLDGKRTATIHTEEPTDLYVIEKETIRSCHADHPHLFRAIASTLAHRLGDNYLRLSKIEEEFLLKELSNDYQTKGKAELQELVQDFNLLKGEVNVLYLEKIWQKYSHRFTRLGIN